MIVGNFAGTLAIYLVLLAYRRSQLGFEFDRDVFRRMTAWGMPFIPSVIALNVIDFADRFLLVRMKGQHELGLYAIGMRISAALLFLLAAFRTAWPAFAYSIPEDEAKRTYGYVLTYVTFFSVLGRARARARRAVDRAPADDAGLLRGLGGRPAARVRVRRSSARYVVVVTSIGRAGRRGSNWIVTGAAALFGIALNFALIPPFGKMGAAASMLLAYFAMFLGITVEGAAGVPGASTSGAVSRPSRRPPRC